MSKVKQPNWKEAITIARNFDGHYSMLEIQQELVYKYTSLLPAGSTIVELGTCHGKTSAILAYLAKYNGYNVHGIDDFSLEGNPLALTEKMNELGLPFNLLVGKTSEVEWDRDIDFLIVDAGHDPGNMQRDATRWVPFVKVGGYVLFHDYEETYNKDSAHWGVRYYADMMTGAWDDVDFLEGLKIRRRPETLKDFTFSLLPP